MQTHITAFQATITTAYIKAIQLSYCTAFWSTYFTTIFKTIESAIESAVR